MEKKSVLFVCLGNICRSPAAEAIFIKLIKEKGLLDSFYVDSAGTGNWHVGKKADKRMRDAAKNRGIEILSRARQINSYDLDKFNFILTMDDSNYLNVIKMKNAKSQSHLAKIYKLQEFSSLFNDKEVPDPYFGGNEGFDYVLDILDDSVSGFLDSIS